MNPRRLQVVTVSIAWLALASLTLSGCAPEPEPEPTPTALFSSDEEAFAAAEATYRAYVDALNEVSSEDPTDFLIGDALESHIDAEQQFLQADVRIDGQTEIRSVKPDLIADGTVSIQVCIDVADTRVINGDGDDVTPADRDERLALDVEFVPVMGRLAISQSVSVGQC